MKSEVLMMGHPQKFLFSLVRVTGLKNADDGHMVGLVLTIVDKDHLTTNGNISKRAKLPRTCSSSPENRRRLPRSCLPVTK